MLSPEKLLALCQEAYTSFNPAAMTMDAHADEFLKLKKVKVKAGCGSAACSGKGRFTFAC